MFLFVKVSKPVIHTNVLESETTKTVSDNRLRIFIYFFNFLGAGLVF